MASAEPSMLSLMFGIILVLCMGAIPVAFIGCLVMACVRKTRVWWVLTGVSAVLAALMVIPVLFIAARAWQQGAARAQAVMQEQAAMEALMATGQSPDTRKIVCSNGLAAIQIPASWADLTVEINNEDASISVGTLELMRYCILVSESKEEFIEVFGGGEDPFAKYTAIVSGFLMEDLEDGEATATRPATLPNVANATYTTAKGKTEGYDIEYCLYTMETASHFHQLMMWSADPSAGETAPLFEAVAKSFELMQSPIQD